MPNNEEGYVLYTRRYFMLFMFCSLNFMQAFQWLQYSIITNIIVRYYNVSTDDVNWTSVITFLVLVPLMIPCTWILERVGLRNYLILGAVFNFAATVVKCFSVRETLFWVTLVGQALSGISTPFIQPLSAQMARTWFPKHTVSRATGFGVFSMYFGNMISSILPVLLVPDSQNKEHIANGLSRMFVGQAVFAALQLTLILWFFEDRPQTPPSKSEATAERIRVSESYWQSMKRVLNVNVVLLIFVYGFCGSESNSFLTVLNEMILTNFANREKLVGVTGLLVNVGSMMSTFIIGYVLDKYRCHKLLIFVCYGTSAGLFLAIAFSMYIRSILLVIAAASVLGLTINSYTTIIFNFAAELTYPEPEGVSSALCVLNSQILSSLVTFIVSGIIQSFGVVAANFFYSSLLVAAMILAAFVNSDLRQEPTDNEAVVIVDNDAPAYQTM